MALRRFNPESFVEKWSDAEFSPTHSGKTFRDCIAESFGIAKDDNYVYRAAGETTLTITQRAIDAKRAQGLHGWYHEKDGKPADPEYPTPEEIEAYISLFEPSIALPKAMNAFRGSAKANTLRSHISTYLDSRLHNSSQGLLPNKKDRKHTNPYLSLWAYSCRELDWAGPWPNTAFTKISHHILPIFYHHFGCIVPSYAALHVIAKLAQPSKPSKEPVKPILDIGSGSGYWTYMLRKFPSDSNMLPLNVCAIDNETSEYRVSWIHDTIKTNGMDYLAKNNNGKDSVLLLVYPQTTGNFTGPILKKFEGDAIVVAGTQNSNGFTAFKDVVVDEWVAKNLKDWELSLRMPLPSFAGKDEAMFVFQRKKKA